LQIEKYAKELEDSKLMLVHAEGENPKRQIVTVDEVSSLVLLFIIELG